MQNKLAPIVECAHLSDSDFDQCGTVIVKTGRASNFRVERQAPGVFIVYGRTEFSGGSTVVRGIDAVRRLLVTR